MRRRQMQRRTSSQLAADYDLWYHQWVSEEIDEALFTWQDAALEVAGDSYRDASVIDIGCGAGRLTRELVLRGARDVVGVDISGAALRLARARTGGLVGRVQFRQADIESMPWPNESFEVAFCCETIEHVLHPARALAETRRLLIPGGVLVLTAPNYLSLLGLHRASYSVRRRRYTEGGQPVNNVTMWPRVVWWLRRAGFVVESVRLTGYTIPWRHSQGDSAHASSKLHRVLQPFRPIAIFRAVRPARTSSGFAAVAIQSRGPL